MISLISPALIIALSCPLPLHEASMHSCELTVQACVDEQASHFGHEAAEELSVGDLFEHDVLAAERATQTARQPRAIGVVQRHRAAHACANAALSLVVEFGICRADRFQMVGASLRGYQREEIRGELRELQPARELSRDAALGRRGD